MISNGGLRRPSPVRPKETQQLTHVEWTLGWGETCPMSDGGVAVLYQKNNVLCV